MCYPASRPGGSQVDTRITHRLTKGWIRVPGVGQQPTGEHASEQAPAVRHLTTYEASDHEERAPSPEIEAVG